MPASRSSDTPRSHRRQPAVSTACDFCRRRKIRCDGKQPCDKCQQHDRANTCHFQDRQSTRKSNGTAPALHDAQDRIRQLEDQLASIHRRPSTSALSDAALEASSATDQSYANAGNPRQPALDNEQRRVATTSSYAGSDVSDQDDSLSRASTSRQTPALARATPSEQRRSRTSLPAVSPARASSPSPTSPTSSAVATIIADLGHPRHSIGNAPRTPTHASPNQQATRGVMSNLRVNNRGESRYHGPTSASFSAPEPSTSDRRSHADVERGGLSADVAREDRPQRLPLDPALLNDRLTSMAARERQQEVMNVVSGKLDFDGVEPELAIHLLNLHWNRQHHAYLVTYRPLFMRDMAAPPGKAKYFSKLLFHAILFGAAKFSDRIDQVRSDVNDPSTAGLQFLERVQQLLPEALIKSRITTVQALLLLACTHYARGSESAAWLHSGLAFRMAVDLGMNEDSIELVASGTMTLEELELRRRVVWGAYVIDKIHSLYQGRQASIEWRNLYVPIEFYDHFEETEFWTPVAYRGPACGETQRVANTTPAGYTGPIYSVSTFTELCRLTVIMEKIIHLFYSIDSGSRPERAQTEHLIGMRSELAAWRTSLPAHLRIDSISPGGRCTAQRSRTRPPNLISLHALYHALTILLNRPFLPHGHLRSDDPATGRSAWKACVDAASSISSLMNLYRQTVSMKGAPQLISYINFCAAGIHVRLAAQLQQRPPSNATGEAANMAASSRRYELKALRQCLRDFEENQDPNPGVVKAKSVISNMAERAGILDLLQNGGGDEGGLSPMANDESPPLHVSGGGNGGNGVPNGNDTVTSSMATQNASALSMAPSAAGGALSRASAVDNSAMGVTPPYEIDFESILASFDQFDSTAGTASDSLFAGSSDAATNSDILFGFLRDYDPPTANSMSTNSLSLA
ncbi:related to nitrogen assimilation transcription factor nit-4 [Ustilago trichophora]|uniref:Related to nitrogen assimilation transcription factor nit-4 n=1 Tax=Ustilago trichophora TaxID=86804 RepID=A0A5C3EGH6_9BASI|nr:related to nitrogen assimilation transcription factor nit-4 [Ustilago trichophora]